ncbi:MAG: SAM-dependent methyltransferase [Muribaculaceae bacterium]|nr:SAM-dependent methyltransferase [Muribaculaceae bacterium]
MNNNARLYLFPVPLSDNPVTEVLPAHNIELIKTVKYFIVENLRSARRFLKQCDRSIDIDSLTFFTLNEHTDASELTPMLAPMEAGNDVGIISEAGCPAVADPGADIVAIAQQRGYTVVPLVGPSSILMGVMASGFNGQSFAFNGYLPIDQGARAARLKELERRIIREHQTQIFIETPYRNNRLIAELCRSLPGNMRLCVASDITGARQSIVTLPLSKWAKREYNYDKTPTIFLLYS